MMSYRFKRRSFLQGVGGAVGLKVLLRNLEASAQGAKSPPRMLVTHWPVGIVVTGFNPTSGSTGGSVILKPFADAGLSADMTVFRGVSAQGLSSGGGGGHEGGTVKLVTGVSCPGTRSGLPEGDDAYSGGPSYDQIFLKNAAVLKPPGGGQGYANSIADSRVDFLETSTQCLSYDYTKQGVAALSGSGQENIPLLPVLSPVQQFMNLFNGFVPQPPAGGTGGAGGGAPPVDVMMLKALWRRKSCLDFAITELGQLRTLAPAAEASKIDIHTDAIRTTEMQLANQINNMTRTGAGGSSGTGTSSCTTKPTMPSVTGAGKSGSMNNYGRETTTTEDGPTHAAVGAAHMEVLKAAMVCDIIRVGTFQWSPGTNHVSFKGLYPGEAATIYMHHPLSHRIGDTEVAANPLAAVAQFLQNAQIWYYTQHANILKGWKTQLDGMGNSLLDNCVVPFLTEVRSTGHSNSDMAAMIIGGKSLGFTHGASGTFRSGNVSINSYWGTVAQAFGLAATAPIGSPVTGLWTKPA